MDEFQKVRCIMSDYPYFIAGWDYWVRKADTEFLDGYHVYCRPDLDKWICNIGIATAKRVFGI